MCLQFYINIYKNRKIILFFNINKNLAQKLDTEERSEKRD